MKIQTRSIPSKPLAALEGEAVREFAKIVHIGTQAIKYVIDHAKPHPDEPAIQGKTVPEEPLQKSAQTAALNVQFPPEFLPIVEEAQRYGEEEFVLLLTGEKSSIEQEIEEEARAAENRREELWISLYNEYRRKGMTADDAVDYVLKVPAYKRALASRDAANNKKSNLLGSWHRARERVTDVWQKILDVLPPLTDPMYKDPKKIWELANQHESNRRIPAD